MGKDLPKISERIRRYLPPWANLDLPPDWHAVPSELTGGYRYTFVRHNGLRVVGTNPVESGGRRWLHISVGREDRMPSWEDLLEARNVFFPGRAVWLEMNPDSAGRYRNMHPYNQYENYVNMWHCLSEEILPEPLVSKNPAVLAREEMEKEDRESQEA